MFYQQDPFKRPFSGARLDNKDYTRFVRWTPAKIAAMAMLIGLPYLVVVLVVAWKLSIGAAVLLVILPLFIGLILGAMYWLAKSSL